MCLNRSVYHFERNADIEKVVSRYSECYIGYEIHSLTMMFLLYNVVIFFLASFMYVNGQFYLYQSSDETINPDDDHDCLDFYPIWKYNEMPYSAVSKRSHQIIPFCRRDSIIDGTIVVGDDVLSYTFNELNNRNVTSQELVEWSAPIELAELYQAYLESNNSQLKHAASLRFYNCSPTGRFGYFCQYYFPTSVSRLFNQIFMKKSFIC